MTDNMPIVVDPPPRPLALIIAFLFDLLALLLLFLGYTRGGEAAVAVAAVSNLVALMGGRKRPGTGPAGPTA